MRDERDGEMDDQGGDDEKARGTGARAGEKSEGANAGFNSWNRGIRMRDSARERDSCGAQRD
jgi:hypothetical protein